MDKRTLEEQVDYFKTLSDLYWRDAARTEDERDKAVFIAKAEAYELAAFELVHNMEH